MMRRVIGVIATAWPGISTGRIVVVIFVLRFLDNKTVFIHSQKITILI